MLPVAFVTVPLNAPLKLNAALDSAFMSASAATFMPASGPAVMATVPVLVMFEKPAAVSLPARLALALIAVPVMESDNEALMAAWASNSVCVEEMLVAV